MKTLLVYPPFCTPAIPPYSITYLASFLKDNNVENIDALDLNILFHKIKFNEYYKYYKTSDYEKNEYNKITKEFNSTSSKVYSDNNKHVVNGKNPELIKELLNEIILKKPDIVGFSIIYSSQSFYTYALIKELKKLNIKTVIGGPSVNEKLINVADIYLKNEVELLEYISIDKIDHDKLNCNTSPDFSIYNLEDYFIHTPVIPIKTCSTCYYQKCTFCTHHGGSKYYEYDLKKYQTNHN